MKPEELLKKLPGIGKDRFLLLFLMGLLLIVIAIPVEQKKKTTDVPEEKAENTGENLLEGESEGGINYDQTGDYGVYTAKKLEAFLSQIEGAGSVRVYVAMQSSQELVVEKNNPYMRKNEEETDGNGTHTISEIENDSEVVLYEKEDGSQSPLVVKRIEPSVRGIVVAAQGGASESVRKNISEALQALFGIEEHKIKVVKLNT